VKNLGERGKAITQEKGKSFRKAKIPDDARGRGHLGSVKGKVRISEGFALVMGKKKKG